MGDKFYNQWRVRLRVPDPTDEDPDEFDYITVVIYDWSEKTNPARNPNDAYMFQIGSKDLDGPYYIHQLIGESP